MGVGSYKSCCLLAKSCPTLLWPHGQWSPRFLCPWAFPGKNAISSSRGSLTQGLNHVSCTYRQILYHWANREAQGWKSREAEAPGERGEMSVGSVPCWVPKRQSRWVAMGLKLLPWSKATSFSWVSKVLFCLLFNHARGVQLYSPPVASFFKDPEK